MDNLDLVTTQELLDELERRFDHGAIGMLREDRPDITVASRCWGNSFTIAGLADYVNCKATDKFIRAERDSMED